MKHMLLICWVLLQPLTVAFATPGMGSGPDSIHHGRFNTLVIGGGAAYAVTLFGLNELWYSDHPRESFHFFDDNAQWKQVDKAGHFFSAYQLGHAGTRALLWTGMSEKKSHLWGGVMGFLMMVPIEFMDGFSSQYGASWGDIAANAAGAGFLYGQYTLWKEIRIHPKFSFHQTTYPDLRPDVLGSGYREELLKDYNGQAFWLSFDLYQFGKKENHFPKWLNVAFGYGAENLVYAHDQSNAELGFDSYRQYFLSLDFDLTHIRSKSALLKTMIYLVNMIHLPAPALEFNRKDKVKFHYLYF